MVGKRFINTVYEAEGLEPPRVTEARELLKLRTQQELDKLKEIHYVIHREVSPVYTISSAYPVEYVEMSIVLTPADNSFTSTPDINEIPEV